MNTNERQVLEELKEIFFQWMSALPPRQVTNNKDLWDTLKSILRAFRVAGI